MKLRNANWFIAIVLIGGLLATGCTELAWKREQPAAGAQARSEADRQWGRAPESPASKTARSFFFNEKSREIEESLGL